MITQFTSFALKDQNLPCARACVSRARAREGSAREGSVRGSARPERAGESFYSLSLIISTSFLPRRFQRRTDSESAAHL